MSGYCHQRILTGINELSLSLYLDGGICIEFWTKVQRYATAAEDATCSGQRPSYRRLFKSSKG